MHSYCSFYNVYVWEVSIKENLASRTMRREGKEEDRFIFYVDLTYLCSFEHED